MAELKTYKKQMGIFWWTEKMSHLKFIARELTSLTVAFFTIELVLLIEAILEGPTMYEGFLNFISAPFWIVLNVAAAIGLIFHSITWFNLAPKAMVIKVGKNKLPGFLIALGNYIGWIIVSIVIIWVLT